MNTYTATRQIITGDTYPVKDAIKRAGARWDSAAREWVVTPDTRVDQLPAGVTVATVVDDDAVHAAIRRERPGIADLDHVVATIEEMLAMGTHPQLIENILSINWSYDEWDNRDDIWSIRWVGAGDPDSHAFRIEDRDGNLIRRIPFRYETRPRR